MTPSRTALVTGGSRGLGYHVASCLAERGYHVTIVGRNADRLVAAVRQFAGSTNRWLALDLSIEDQVEELVRHVERNGFDVLVNNAGAARFGPLSALTSDMLQHQLRLNLIAPACLSWAFVKCARPGSILVNVTSIVGRVPMPGNAAYSAAKAGLQALTECLWYEMLSAPITVLDFRPVSIKTDFHRTAGSQSMSPAAISVEAKIAARDLVDAVEKNRAFVHAFGPGAMLLELASRLLPRKLLIQIMGRKSRKMKYL